MKFRAFYLDVDVFMEGVNEHGALIRLQADRRTTFTVQQTLHEKSPTQTEEESQQLSD